jgi:hypothetical protein
VTPACQLPLVREIEPRVEANHRRRRADAPKG